MADEHDIGSASPTARAAQAEKPDRAGESARETRASGAEKASGSSAAADGAAAAGPQPQIDELRRRIDQIDDQLMRLLNARSACAVEIGRLKRRASLPIYQPDREKWILDRAARNNPGPLDSDAVRRVFERVIDESRRLERLAGEAEQGKADGKQGG